jgi:glycosyltransferase involved in cell wall biosynthesis
MRVLIDTTYAERAPLSGTGIYIRRLCEELQILDGVEPVAVANRSRRPAAGGGLGSLRNLAADLRWAVAELPRLARRHRAQLIHHPLPSRAPTSTLPQVTTVVDLAFERLPELFDPRFRRYAHLTHRAAARAARAVICISETTAGDARELWQVRPERIVVAPLGPGQELAPRRPRAPEPAHFLYVGDAEPRKNLPVLLEAYRLYRDLAPGPLDLVLAGSARASAPGVRLIERPSSGALSELYLDAAALVHPSLYEGFGITLVEAMALGTPVLAAAAPGTTETCGDAARYADAHSPHAFAQAMLELAHDPVLGQALALRGHRRAQAFSWATCARAHRDAYSLALGA